MIMARLRAVVVLPSLLALSVGAGAPAAPAPQIATPGLSSWERVSSGVGDAWIMVGEAPVQGASWRPGAIVLCTGSGSRVGAYFGPFPPDGRLVQFAVRLPD